MRKIILILLISLLGMTSSFSQTIYPKMTQDSLIVITPLQLKKTNLIFLEHSKFLQQIPLLESQIQNLEKINSDFEKSDSIRQVQLNRCLTQLQTNTDALIKMSNSLTESEKKAQKWRNWTIGGVGVSVGLALILLLK